MRISDWSSDVCSSDLPSLMGAVFYMQYAAGSFPHQVILGQQLDVVARKLAYCFAHDLFAGAHSVNRSGINGCDPQFVGFVQGLDRFAPVGTAPHPAADGPCSEGNHRDIQITVSELSVFHRG